MTEETVKTKERTFFIRVTNLNIENGKPLFVGPYKSSKEAEESINKAMYNGQELMEGEEFIDESTLNVSIVGGTAAKREGMKDSLEEMPVIEKWQTYFQDGDMYKSNRGRPKKDEEKETEEKPRSVIQKQPAQTIKTNGTISNIPSVSKSKGKSDLDPHKVVIVTSNSNIIVWLAQQGIRGEIISFVNHPSQVMNKIVIGVLPAWLAAVTEKFAIVNIPGMKKEDLAGSISPEEISARGGRLDWYKTIKLDE